MKVRPRLRRIIGLTGTPFFQRTYGSMGRIQGAGYGSTARSLHYPVPDKLLHAG